MPAGEGEADSEVHAGKASPCMAVGALKTRLGYQPGGPNDLDPVLGMGQRGRGSCRAIPVPFSKWGAAFCFCWGLT